MRDERIVESYAIGGGIAAMYYIDPVSTFDLDVFVILPNDSGGLISLDPIYSWLKKHGYMPAREQVIIEGVPVQFIPIYNELIKDAVRNALQKNYGVSPALIVGPEYLMAIMVQTGRPKDRDRCIKFMEETKISETVLSAILEKHHLSDAFLELKRNNYGK
jgi:hypothetical protein